MKNKTLLNKIKKEKYNLEAFMEWLERETKLNCLSWGLEKGEIFLIIKKGKNYYKYKGGKKWKKYISR